MRRLAAGIAAIATISLLLAGPLPAASAKVPPPPKALTAATIDAHYAVNVRAPMLLSALLARSGRPGRIVNLISGQFLGPMPGELAYAASKGAVEAFTTSVAPTLAARGITINAVNPGPTDTG